MCHISCFCRAFRGGGWILRCLLRLDRHRRQAASFSRSKYEPQIDQSDSNYELIDYMKELQDHDNRESKYPIYDWDDLLGMMTIPNIYINQWHCTNYIYRWHLAQSLLLLQKSSVMILKLFQYNQLTPEEMDRLTANMWTHPYAAIARSETLDAELARWQRKT
jgi:hypothetical protein